MTYHSYIKSGALSANSWSVPDLCAAYGIPRDLPGGGIIAIVELGGGWLPSDNNAFFLKAGLPPPVIIDISVDGPRNSPGISGADGEVALDIQVAAAVYAYATGKPAEINMYWADNANAEAIAIAVDNAWRDGCDTCSISWGADEEIWGVSQANSMEQVAIAATASGMTILAASGDNDSSDGGPTPANVDLPAACPHVVGCGGTMKPRHGVETVWNNNPGKADGEGTGGGYSTIFAPMPLWQAGAPHGPGRMVPDVSANADPNTGYEIIVGGKPSIVGGTSAVAPFYAGFLAATGMRLGFVAPKLYLNHLAFNDITIGDNGKFRARLGPDPCTGIGTLRGKQLAQLLMKSRP
jgi:subtilase family serine protease